MPVGTVLLEKVLPKWQLLARSSAAVEKLVSFWVIEITLVIFLLIFVSFCAVLLVLAVVLVGLHWG